VKFVQSADTRASAPEQDHDYMPNPTFERVAAPARTRSSTPPEPEGLSMREIPVVAFDTPPGARNPDRIAELDRQGSTHA